MSDIHYIIPVSLNDSSRKRKPILGRARKQPMNPIELTFEQLKSLYFNSDSGRHDSKQTKANLASALKAFMNTRGVSDSTVIGSTLRLSFYKSRDAHLRQLSDSGKSKPYIANRKTYLNRWHKFVLALDGAYSDATRQDTPFMALLKTLISNVPLKRLAKQVGVTESTLRGWKNGAKPNERARASLLRLERYFALPANQLVSLSGLDQKAKEKLDELDKPVIKYRERLKKHISEHHALNNANESLRSEWGAFMHYKTAKLIHGKARQRQGRWNTTSEKIVQPTEHNWFAFHGNQYVASANINWRIVSGFLGWMRLPIEQGGRGMGNDVVQTLAHLNDSLLLGQYIEWQIERSEYIVHRGIIATLQFVKSLCHPKTGYLCHTQELAQRLSLDLVSWQQRCDQAFDFAKDNIGSLSSQLEVSRSSFEPLRNVLELNSPMDAVADAVQRHAATRPSSGGKTEAIWMRDRLLMKLLSSNPLRVKNLKLLKFSDSREGISIRGEDTGVLYRGNDGGWYIAIPRKHFKNTNGAARERDYDMPVHESLWRDIEAYIRVFRPMIAKADNPYLFVSTVKDEGMMYSLNRRVEALTRKYFWRCPGFGSHGFRHIVATSILKQSPNDWQTAALVLHDKIETVQQHYAHGKALEN